MERNDIIKPENKVYGGRLYWSGEEDRESIVGRV